MIVFDLVCDAGHRFEGWFGSSGDYSEQLADGLLTCPECGSGEVTKAPMSPAVGRKGNQQPAAMSAASEVQPVSNAPMPPEVAKALEKLAEAQAQALKGSTWVGDRFAEQSRAMHYGERDQQIIHGEATADEARELLDEGIAVAPLPFPVAPPDKMN
jgi:hypothetical protein